MRQMRFTTVQELKSQPKLLSWLYAKDLLMIAGFVCVMSVFQGLVHPACQTAYFIWNIFVGLALALPSPFNVKMHIYESLVFIVKKDRFVYKPIFIPKDSENDVIR